jgi:hypothetical protein
MAEQISVVADPLANVTQGGVNLPTGSTSLKRIANGGAIWILTLTSTFSTFGVGSLKGHVPNGDLVVVIGTDVTHAVLIGSNGLVETQF